MEYTIRKMQKEEYHVLENFLYEAIFVPEGNKAPSKEIIRKPELQVYISDFGKKKDDICLVAEVDGEIIGAVWVRIMDDYGHVDNETPSFAISIYKEYRSCGIGTALMQSMLKVLKEKGYKQTSLAVQKSNYAVKMYKKVGFEIIDENEEEYIMVCKLLDTMKYSFKRLDQDELTAIKELFVSVFAKEPWNDDWSDEKQLQLYIQDLTEQNNSLTFGLYEEDELVGVSMGHVLHWFAGTQYFINELCISSSKQGKGIGTLFVNEIEKACKELEITYLFLLTEDNVPAFEFYTKQGFCELKNNVAFVKKL